MVMPRSRSSGALSMLSKARNSAPPFSDRVLVIAAVSVVLPWSMCPMVPTFTCGLLRSNFFFATSSLLPRCRSRVSPPRGSNPRPRPYQGRALPTELGGHVLLPDIKRRLLSATPSALGTPAIIRLWARSRQRAPIGPFGGRAWGALARRARRAAATSGGAATASALLLRLSQLE